MTDSWWFSAACVPFWTFALYLSLAPVWDLARPKRDSDA